MSDPKFSSAHHELTEPTHYRGPVLDEAGVFARWQNDLNLLDFALQPIVHAVTGATYAVEALVRGFEAIGYDSPHALFDAAFQENVLFFVDIRLREKAIAKFKTLPFSERLILFYNYDPRMLEMPDYRPGVTESLMANFELSSDQICFEINEKYQIQSNQTLNGFVRNLQDRGIKIALDDFGSGYAGFELFYHSEPNLLKFDRFLISNIESDVRKRNLCSHMINLCKVQGVTTVAEGVETAAELNICRTIGFDLIQGYFVARPTTEVAELSPTYESVVRAHDGQKRRATDDAELVTRSILQIETISIDADVRTLLDKFHDQLQYNFFPILDSNDYPLGIVHERMLKKYIYSPFGRELLANKSVTRGLRNFISRSPVADIYTPQDKILEIFVNNADCEGVIIVKDLKYFGFLNAKSLLSIINEKQLEEARDTNPLTGLPGNRLIHAFVDNVLSEGAIHAWLVYFDFDHFKPFNDHFGFRQGDRALSLFAQILKEIVPTDVFIGHIGGDDFFLGLNSSAHPDIHMINVVTQIQQRFADEIRPFFTPEERAGGHYSSLDRKNQKAEFPLLAVSAAIIEVTAGSIAVSFEKIAEVLARLKKQAKADPEHLAIAKF